MCRFSEFWINKESGEWIFPSAATASVSTRGVPPLPPPGLLATFQSLCGSVFTSLEVRYCLAFTKRSRVPLETTPKCRGGEKSPRNYLSSLRNCPQLNWCCQLLHLPYNLHDKRRRCHSPTHPFPSRSSPSPAPPDTHICIKLKKPNSAPCCRQPRAAGGTREGNILPVNWTRLKIRKSTSSQPPPFCSPQKIIW